MEYLVTGGTGFIGSHLIEELVDKGNVTAITNVKDYWHIPEGIRDRVDLKVLDIGDLDEVMGLGSYDIVFHLAAIAHPAEAETIPDVVRKVNIDGTRHICELVERRGGHLIFSSTGYVYGDVQYSPVDEEHPLRPKNIYGRSKLEAEMVIRNFVEEKGIKATILRLFNIYGPRQRDDYIIPKTITRVLKGEELRLGNPDPVRGFAYIKDLAACLVKVSEDGRSCGRTYNVGSDKGITIKDLVSTILRLMGSEVEPIYDKTLFRAKEVMEMLVKNDRVRNDIGWVPTTPLEEGLARTIDYYINV